MKQLILLLLFSFTSTLISQIKYVPTDYAIIQHAINDADDGDVIIVREGTYCQQINFTGKAITVASEFYLDGDTSHISRTIIDGMFLDERDSSSLVYINSGEDSTSILTGFTFQNGKGTYFKGEYETTFGGAISLDKSGATISNNIFKNNKSIINGLYYNDWSGAFGGAIDCYQLPKKKTVIISKNRFENNSIKSKTAQAFGGAILIMWSYGNVIIDQNEIIGNKVESVKSGYGGGICIAGISGDSKVIIENNIISNNSTYSSGGSTKGGGIACYFSAPIIRNNIIVENETQYPQSISHDAFGGGIAVFWYLDFEDEWSVCEDPYSLIVVIENNTIAYNNDKLAGGGVALRSVGARLNNNIIGCNFAENNAQIKVEYREALETKDRTIKTDYCNIEGGVEGVSQFYNGTGNINKFPEYSDEEHWYLKRDLSPCIDAGDPSKEYEDIEDAEHVGRACFPALGSRRNDIGAFGGPYSKWAEMGIATDVQNNEPVLMPNEPFLSQNYPNPFNPSTTIKYSIPTSVISNPSEASGERAQGLTSNEISPFGRNDISFVSLKVYDILGREVATLVNEIQKPGNYEVEFNCHSGECRNLTSGIYFYKLQSGEFIQTKKMLMIK